MLLILTLPAIAPPLPHVEVVFSKGPGQVVVCPLAHDGEECWAIEGDERQLLQVDLMDLTEDLLPLAHIRCRQFLCVKSIQGVVAVEFPVVSVGRDLVA
jgi:hypothetical protein